MATVIKRKNSKYWVARFTDQRGRQRQKSTKTTDQTRALEIAEEYERWESAMRNYKDGFIAVASMVGTASLWYFALPYGFGYMFFASIIVGAVLVVLVLGPDAISLCFNGDALARISRMMSAYPYLWQSTFQTKRSKHARQGTKGEIMGAVAALFLACALILYEVTDLRILSGILCVTAAILILLSSHEPKAKPGGLGGGIGGSSSGAGAGSGVGGAPGGGGAGGGGGGAG